MCVNNLSKVALDSAAAGTEPATSSRKSNALTTAPSSITVQFGQFLVCCSSAHGAPVPAICKSVGVGRTCPRCLIESALLH